MNNVNGASRPVKGRRAGRWNRLVDRADTIIVHVALSVPAMCADWTLIHQRTHGKMAAVAGIRGWEKEIILATHQMLHFVMLALHPMQNE